MNKLASSKLTLNIVRAPLDFMYFSCTILNILVHYTASSSSSITTTAQTPSLRYKDLETKINKWTSELQQQEQLFLTQATQVNAWNKFLIDNSEKVEA